MSAPFDSLTPAQLKALTAIAFGGFPYAAPRTIKALLERDLIEDRGLQTVGHGRFGPIRVPMYEMPISAHIAFCAWCEANHPEREL